MVEATDQSGTLVVVLISAIIGVMGRSMTIPISFFAIIGFRAGIGY